MENRLTSTEKQVNEQRATPTIFPALQRLYRTSVEFSGQDKEEDMG